MVAVSPLNAAILIKDSKTDLQPFLVYYIDDIGSRDIEEIHRLDTTDWQVPENQQVNFGFDERFYWFKIELSSYQNKQYILQIAYSLLDNIDLYVMNKNGILQSYHTGDLYLFNQRPLNHRNFLFPLDMKKNEVQSVFIRIKTSGALQLPIFIWDKNEFLLHENKMSLFQGVFVGIMLVMCLYNLFLFFSLKDKSYLIYVGFVLVTALFQTSLQGLTYQYLWPNSSWWNGQSIAVFAVASLAFAIYFTISFLKLEKGSTRLFPLFRLLGILAVAITISNFFIPFHWGINLARSLGVIVPPLIFSIGVKCWLKGNLSARYFTIAWFLLIVGTLIMVFTKSGILVSNWLTENAMAIGSVFEVILLSLALAQNFTEERKKRLVAQENLLTSERDLRMANEKTLFIQLEANEKLELKVHERTIELETTMKQLSEANTMLRNLSARDGLTGVYNRRAFDERFELEWKRAVRSKSKLALIMVDIDHFKTLNDRYGHQAGDECLKKVAEVIDHSFNRPGDFVARYGGEEFIIILPEVHKEGCTFCANRLLKNIESLAVKYNDEILNITASLGVSVESPDYNDSPHFFIEKADRALYHAKKQGRNRVAFDSDDVENISNK